MVVLVTGSSKGIGSSIIKEFAKNKYDVIINYNNDYKSALELKEYVESTYKVNADIIKCDISNEKEIIEMINMVKSKYMILDVLVNNAGCALDNDIFSKTKDEFMKVLEVNLVGTFLVTKYALEKLNPKTIINISSTDSVDTYNDISIDYCASKAGINVMTKILSSKFTNIKVCAVLPNWTRTPSVDEMNPIFLSSELKRIGQKRLLSSDEVANKVYEVVINENIKTGSLVRIDGE